MAGFGSCPHRPGRRTTAPGAALAGFQVSINGRFWVSTEVAIALRPSTRRSAPAIGHPEPSSGGGFGLLAALAGIRLRGSPVRDRFRLVLVRDRRSSLF